MRESKRARERERERESERVCVCVRESVCVWERVCVCECLCVGACVSVCHSLANKQAEGGEGWCGWGGLSTQVLITITVSQCCTAPHHIPPTLRPQTTQFAKPRQAWPVGVGKVLGRQTWWNTNTNKDWKGKLGKMKLINFFLTCIVSLNYAVGSRVWCFSEVTFSVPLSWIPAAYRNASNVYKQVTFSSISFLMSVTK